MAIVAKMMVSKVEALGGGRFIPAEEGEPGAVQNTQATSVYTDPPEWLLGSNFLRYDQTLQSAEIVALNCVAMPAGTDPDRTNAKWANASPSGQLNMTIHNPEAWGYVKPGYEYRVTIERIRGPRGDD